MSEERRRTDVPPAAVQMQLGRLVPLRDGVQLNATVYLPPNHAVPAPAIFTLTPYIGQACHERGLYFASHGYPFLAVDARGRGNSGGQFQPFIQEAKDGYDVVEWIAKQPFCNGRVAMWGGSYTGYDQWATAKEFPPHLATIVPVAAVYPGLDFPIRNNMGYPYVVQWLTLVAGRASQEKMFVGNEPFWAAHFRLFFESGEPFNRLDSFFGNSSATFQEWLGHSRRDAYWDSHNPTAEQHANLYIPILTITGIYDDDQPGALAHYSEHMRNTSDAGRARHYLVIGPWDHAGTRAPQRTFAGVEFGSESLLDLNELHLQWYSWVMRGGQKPSFLQKNVAYYVTGAERWRYADTLEGITTQCKPLYLRSSGTACHIFASGHLSAEVGDDDSCADTYVYDPRDVSIAELESGWTEPSCLRPFFPCGILTDQRAVYARDGKELIYHSGPFERDTEISGFFRLSAWISIDQPDTDFSVAIYELDLNGFSLLLTADAMRARYRDGLRAENLVRTADPLNYNFESFTFVSRLVRKGSRLRLVIGPMSSIHYQKNYNSGRSVSEESVRDAKPVTIRLFHGQRWRSVLYVPLGNSEG